MSIKKIYHLVGEQPVPIFLPAIQFGQEVEHYLLTTNSPRTLRTKDHLHNELERCGYHAEDILLGEENAATDFSLLNEKISEIIRNTNPNQEECAFNVTGGTKPMALVGMHCCRQANYLKAFYMDFEKRKIVWLDNFEEQVLQNKLTISNFIGFSGVVMQQKGKDDSASRARLTELCHERSIVLQEYQGAIAFLLEKHSLKQKKKQGNANKPNPQNKKEEFFKLKEMILQKFEKNKRKEWETEAEKAFNGNWEAEAKYLSGGWFEDYVYNKIKKMPSVLESAENLVLNWPSGGIAQEFDVAYTDGYSFIILECKAGKIKQEYIQKLENLRDHFSGALGKCALVTLNSPYTKNNKKENFAVRISSSRSVAAFCGQSGIRLLSEGPLGFVPGKIYGE